MRIDFTTLGTEPPESGKPGRAAPADGNSTSSASGASSSNSIRNLETNSASNPGLDQTRFSFPQARVQSLQAQVLAQPEIRLSKVQALQQAIGSGGYSVPPSQIADALASDLGNEVRG